jgi:hypothetical protein
MGVGVSVVAEMWMGVLYVEMLGGFGVVWCGLNFFWHRSRQAAP